MGESKLSLCPVTISCWKSGLLNCEMILCHAINSDSFYFVSLWSFPRCSFHKAPEYFRLPPVSSFCDKYQCPVSRSLFLSLMRCAVTDQPALTGIQYSWVVNPNQLARLNFQSVLYVPQNRPRFRDDEDCVLWIRAYFLLNDVYGSLYYIVTSITNQ